VFAGALEALTLHRPKVAFSPDDKENRRGPDYRVILQGPPGAVELGVTWKRASQAGRDFLSGRLETRRRRAAEPYAARAPPPNRAGSTPPLTLA